MEVHRLSTATGQLFNYTEKYHVYLESLAHHFKRLASTRYVSPKIDLHYKYDGDLYGYLADIEKIPHQHHLFIARINGYSSSDQFRFNYTDVNVLTLMIPDSAEITAFNSVYLTFNK